MRIRQTKLDIYNENINKNIWCHPEGWEIYSGRIVSLLIKKLTVKQRSIVDLLYRGMSYKYISEELKVDKTTIRDHMERIRVKTRKAVEDWLKQSDKENEII